MTDPTPTAVADGTEYPYVQDLDQVWHRRPADDSWDPAPDLAQCASVCGKAIASVHVSSFHPAGDDMDGTLCDAGCFEGPTR